jgi:hypothetical protein
MEKTVKNCIIILFAMFMLSCSKEPEVVISEQIPNMVCFNQNVNFFIRDTIISEMKGMKCVYADDIVTIDVKLESSDNKDIIKTTIKSYVEKANK